MTDISKRLNQLTPEQRKLLKKKLSKKGIQPTMLDAKQSLSGKSAKTSNRQRRLNRSVSPDKEIKFGLSFFSSNTSAEGSEKYKLLLECAKFGDEHGFESIWTPERHFETFGGLYPNPALLAAALSTATSRIKIRAGSVVLPLHNPIRIAEEWAVADNLSGGRVGFSCATGWNPRDFTLSPENFENRREIMFQNLDIVQRLWAGETVTFTGVDEKEIDIQSLPRPIQEKLPIWLTVSGSQETWKRAAQLGAGIYTMLGPQPIDHLADNIAMYREELKKHGHDPASGIVTVVLHTFLGSDLKEVKEKVRAPMCKYLQTYIAQEPVLKQGVGDGQKSEVSERDKEELVSFAFERYFEDSSLLGTPETCTEMVEVMRAADVDEIACLVDFGVDLESIIDSLQYLGQLRNKFSRISNTISEEKQNDG